MGRSCSEIIPVDSIPRTWKKHVREKKDAVKGRPGRQERSSRVASMDGWQVSKAGSRRGWGGVPSPFTPSPSTSLSSPSNPSSARPALLFGNNIILSPNLYYSPLAHRSLTVLIDRIKHLVIVIVLRILIISLALTYHWHCYCYPLSGSHRLVSVIAVVSSMSLGSPLLHSQI